MYLSVCGYYVRASDAGGNISLVVGDFSACFAEYKTACRKIPWHKSLLRIAFKSACCHITQLYGSRTYTAYVVASVVKFSHYRKCGFGLFSAAGICSYGKERVRKPGRRADGYGLSV